MGFLRNWFFYATQLCGKAGPEAADLLCLYRRGVCRRRRSGGLQTADTGARFCVDVGSSKSTVPFYERYRMTGHAGHERRAVRGPTAPAVCSTLHLNTSITPKAFLAPVFIGQTLWKTSSCREAGLVSQCRANYLIISDLNAV